MAHLDILEKSPISKSVTIMTVINHITSKYKVIKTCEKVTFCLFTGSVDEVVDTFAGPLFFPPHYS